MLRFIIILFFSSALFSQAQTESWLDYVIEENKEEISENSSINIDISTLTLIENFVMILMSSYMIIIFI